MNDRILVSAERLNELIESGGCKVVDCRFDFSGAEKGRNEWLAGHIPGASYAHLDNDLAAAIEDHSGRHPLPDNAEFARYLASIGWTSGTLLVAYDGGSNAISSRLWWMMQYYGQSSALLDGGLPAWIEAGLPLESGDTALAPAPVGALVPAVDMTATSGHLLDNLKSEGFLVLDARAPERFSGETENLDTKAGHIPGSLNRPFSDNLGGNGRFRDAAELKAEFEALLGGRGAQHIVHSCGSGVTACHNLFAMQLAGMENSRLYPGSWSQWIRDPDRPIATGN